MRCDFLEQGTTVPHEFFREFNKNINSVPQFTDIRTWQIFVQLKVGSEINEDPFSKFIIAVITTLQPVGRKSVAERQEKLNF